MLDNKDREITLIYHSEKFDDTKALAYTESLEGFAVKTLDLAKENLTQTQLAEIADKLEGRYTALLDTSYLKDTSVNEASAEAMDKGSLLNLLQQNNKLVATPILLIADKAFHMGSSYELIQEKLAVIGVKSSKANRQEKPPDRK